MTEQFSRSDLRAAHELSDQHREAVLRSEECGCFYCQQTFAPSEIEEWTYEDQTALCPRCGIDSVIGDASDLRASNPAFLLAMHREWFGQTHSLSEVQLRKSVARLVSSFKRLFGGRTKKTSHAFD